MQSWLISWIVFCTVGLAFPASLLVLAWRRNRKVTRLLLIPVVAVVVPALAMNHEMRWALLGADYTRRLFVTIGIFTALTLINAVYASIRKVDGSRSICSHSSRLVFCGRG
jgi:hypothetical protein